MTAADVQAALDAMTAAEQEALACADDMEFGEWAHDRLRLVARDRATLERHAPRPRKADDPAATCDGCDGAWWWPCADAQAVLSYWTEER